MNEPQGEENWPFQRIALAFWAFFSVLFRRDIALRVAQLRQPTSGAAAAPNRSPEPPPQPATDPVAARRIPASDRAAVQVLSLLQREGRLVDFVEEDLDGFSDAQIGAAARIVHDGCKRVFAEHFTLEPVYPKSEGAPITVGPGFDPSTVRLSGNVVGNPPFSGSLRHHGWKVSEVRLPVPPEVGGPAIVAPAEVEL